MENTKTKGNLGEMKVALEFIKWGCTVSFPFGDNARYDLVAEINGKLNKIQIKYSGSITENDSYVCKLQSSKNHTTNKTLDSYEQDVDYMAFYIADIDICCLIPITLLLGKTQIILRTTKPKNNQTKGIHFVSDFTFDKILCVETLHDEPTSK